MSNSTTFIKISSAKTKKYSIDGSESFAMSVFVSAFVKHYITNNPLNYNEIKGIFKDDLMLSKYRYKGFVCTKQEYLKLDVKRKEERYYTKNPICSADGIEFYVNTQWEKKSFQNVLELAKKLGYVIISDSSTITVGDNQSICELPSNYDVNLGLHKNVLNAIKEYVAILEEYNDNVKNTITPQQKRRNASKADVLKKYYIEGKKCEEIASELRCEMPNIEQIRSTSVNEVLSGDIFFSKYRLNQGLYDTILSLKSECLFSTLKKIEIYVGATDYALLRAIDLDILNIPNNIDDSEVAIIIPKAKGAKVLYTALWSITKNVLNENPLPTDKDVIEKMIFEKFANDKKIANKFEDKEEISIFIERILECEELVEVDENNRIQIKCKYLNAAAQRIARIVYDANVLENKLTITKREIEQRYLSIYPSCRQLPISSARSFGICSEGRTGNWYYGEPKIPLQQKIREYAEEKIIFFYGDLVEYIRNNGYSLSNSLRTYITNICSVNKNNKDHFCHKDYVEDHDEFEWKAQKKYGWTNWLYNEIKNIFEDKKTKDLQIEEVVGELEKRSKNSEYSNIRKRFFNVITTYCNDDKPFTIKGEKIVINHNIYNSADFEIIGLRGEKYAFYKRIRSLVANETKRAEQGKITLVEIVRLVNEYVDKTIGRGTIIKAIEDKNKRFAPINVEIVNENGTVFVKWNGEFIPAEPRYVVSSEDDNTESACVTQGEEQGDKRPSIRYRQQIDWNELCDALKNELSFYGRWMKQENIDLGAAVDNFIVFLQESNNKNLSTLLPLDLYEYWFACTDSSDRYRYLHDILIMFEGMLGEMYYKSRSEKVEKYGLVKLAEEFDGLSDLFLYSRESKGFKKIACSLHYERNMVAHGEYLDKPSAMMAKSITDYIALYVYVYAKYRVKS